MGKINLGRVILGGLVAGIVINVMEGIMHGMVWVSRDADLLTSLNRPAAGSANQIVALNVWGFAVGILTIALYAAIRPRMGAGPKTAVCAGLFVWAGTSLLGAAIPLILGIYRADMTAMNVGFELVVLALAAVAGAAVYKENAAEIASAARA
jgi:hypothetical protein